MKWFKHMSASWEDEKLSRIVDEAGLEGYGFWWRMVEIVASKVDENNITLVTFSLKKWCSLFVVRPQKLRRLLTLCEDCGMFKSVSDGDMITVDIPNILKYRDEWTKKKASKKPKTPESLPSKEEDTDTEEDTEKNKNFYAPNPVGFSAESGTLVCSSDLAKKRKQNKEPPPAEHLTEYFLPVKSENMSKVAYLKAENWDLWVKTFGEDMCLGCLRHAYSWLLDNPSKAKTVGGIHKFFGSWLDKEQNKGTPPRASPTFSQGRIASSRNGNSYNDGSKRDYGQSDFGALEGAVATGGNA